MPPFSKNRRPVIVLALSSVLGVHGRASMACMGVLAEVSSLARLYSILERLPLKDLEHFIS